MLKPAGPGTDGDDDRSIGDMIGRLFDDGRTYAEAEFALFRAKAEAEVNRYRKAAILAGIGVAFALAALIAFAMTAIIGLSYLLGPLGGGIATVIVLSLAAIWLFYRAKGSIEDPVGAASEDDIDSYD
jgi:hypothetical protein